MNTPTKLFLEIIDLFDELPDGEVLRIELINGNKIYCLPSDKVCVTPAIVKIIKQIKKDKEQIIIINVNTISVICTMSRETYDLKLQRGELYV